MDLLRGEWRIRAEATQGGRLHGSGKEEHGPAGNSQGIATKGTDPSSRGKAEISKARELL